jgi:hypothetical protein
LLSQDSKIGVPIFVKSIEGNGKGREEKDFFSKRKEMKKYKYYLLYDNIYKKLRDVSY